MNAQHIWWIFRREMRDQLRDRRTLFMVAVLPVLMYPLLGSSFFQLSQFMRQHTGRVLLLGAAELTGTKQDSSDFPPLVVDGAFNAELFSSPLDAKRLEVVPPTAAELDAEDAVAAAQGAVKSGRVDVAVVVPEGFAERLRAAREAGQGDADRGPPPELALPVHHDAAREQSQVARLRVDDLLRRWQAEVVRANLAASNVPDAATNPFSVQTVDVATKQRRDAVLWSKLLPFVVFIWALTGAFYPAIDLCAGEKERGTLETLLSSPARRSEIVVGKLLTIMAFSIFTACLNLASLSLTAKVLIGQLAGMMGGGALAPPAWSAIAWLLVALVPIAALFSALSLACASFAKSTKEGQYYFMPLFLGATPLMLAPMSPGVELTLGNALVPVMGLVLLLRALIEGQLALAGTYALPVVAVTTACAWLATRWAVHQFNQESVLFREGERFDLRTQVAAWMRDRGATPSAGAAIACVGLIFFAQFVTRWLTPPPVLGESGLGYFATLMIVGQVACIALPAVLVATTLARDWRRTLLLDRAPRGRDIALATSLAVALHPAGQLLAAWVSELYPLSDSVQQQLEGFMGLLAGAGEPPIAVVLLLMAALPAVCEELAFRGVILSGLRKTLGDVGAVLATAAVFGATHSILAQQVAAAPVGAVIGLVALRTGSLWPCIVLHGVYNALQLLTGLYADAIRKLATTYGVDGALFGEMKPGQLGYSPAVAILGCVAAIALWRAMGTPSGGRPHPGPAATAAS